MEAAQKSRAVWSTRKKDPAPRGVFRHGSGVWAARFTCGAAHVHEEKVGPLKGDAIRIHAARRQRVHQDPSWCPAVERRQAREQARVAAERESRRRTFKEYADNYKAWAEGHQRSLRTMRGEVSRLVAVFGDQFLDSITPTEMEHFLNSLIEGTHALSPATVNRYRDRLSGMFKRAIRLGLVASNPVKGIPKHREAGGRLVFLPPATADVHAHEELAIHQALAPELRPLFTVSVNTGLRWSEQRRLQWRDVDLLTNTITVSRSKNGRLRQLPMNSVVQSLLLELAMRRQRPDDPNEPVFGCRYRDANQFFPKAVERAQAALRATGKNASRLDGYTWHGNRHTFASRLVMAGVDLRAVQELGGWRTLGMVQRYAHLSPAHLQAAVERLVPQGRD